MQNAQSIERAIQLIARQIEHVHARVDDLQAMVTTLQATSAQHEYKLEELTNRVRNQTYQTNPNDTPNSDKLSHTEIT
jgi:peptidoglycan hydrolase CwlO-like protein